MIDSHVHLWQLGQRDCTWPGPDLPAIYRDFVLADLITLLDGHGVDRAIVVQSQPSEVDTRWLLELSRLCDRIAGVVGWIDFSAPDAPDRIDALTGAGRLVGMRPMMQDGPSDAYDDPLLFSALEYLARHGLTLDALVRPRHLASLLRLSQRLPDLRIIIDHAAKPVIGDKLPQDWSTAMRNLAARPMVACKVSGLMTELAPLAEAAAIGPVIDQLFDLFGPDRLIWGSDWPVMTLAGDYGGWTALTRQSIPAGAWDAVSNDNALRIYGISA